MVFTVHPNELQWWKQEGQGPQKVGSPIAANRVASFFDKNSHQLAPDRIYRAKTWGRFQKEFQLSFVDLGLMPLIEAEIGQALDGLIERNVTLLKDQLERQDIDEKKGHWLLQTVFWLVSAKILHDKDVPAFANIDISDVKGVFQEVAKHYGTTNIPVPSRRHLAALEERAKDISRFTNLCSATTEALAYVYENTLVSGTTRTELGTHSTPTFLVDFIIGKLAPWVRAMDLDERSVFEPACGHSAFLVSAMRLLTELLPEEKSGPAERRQYLRKRVHGCEVDSFALEIARLSLTLADIPNPDGWDLIPGDMFSGNVLEKQARSASILLANPPFEDFSQTEKTRYHRQHVTLTYINKTAEMLGRTLPHLRPGAVFGVVVPEGFLHSANSASLRQKLVKDFEIAEICVFPDKVFNFSDMESAVIIGRRIENALPSEESLVFSRLREHDVAEFKRSFNVTTQRHVSQTRFLLAPEWDLRVPELEDIWTFLSGQCCELQQIADVGQGLSYVGKDVAKSETTFSETRFSGAVRGFAHFSKQIRLEELPKQYWLSLSPEIIDRPRSGTTISVPQVLLNYAPSSRGPWRLKALIDKKGHPVTSRLITVRPGSDEYTLEFLWALLNSPVSNGYAYAHLGKRENTVGTIRKIPVPQLAKNDLERITSLVRVYFKVASSESRTDARQKDILADCLLRIDAEIMQLYGIPPHQERMLLDLFASWPRPGIPFEFDRYYPDGFEEKISLHELLAITTDWPSTNELRCSLIDKEVEETITEHEQRELQRLQTLADYRIRLLAPLPIKELEAYHETLTARDK